MLFRSLGSGARAAELCGAVSGAVMVIGLKHGQGAADDAERKRVCNAETEEFLRRFKSIYKDVVCRVLLQCDIATKEGREKALEKELFKKRCQNLVVSAIEILVEMGY